MPSFMLRMFKITSTMVLREELLDLFLKRFRFLSDCLATNVFVKIEDSSRFFADCRELGERLS